LSEKKLWYGAGPTQVISLCGAEVSKPVVIPFANTSDRSIPVDWTSHLGMVLLGITFLEWGLFCQHIHWDMSLEIITLCLFTFTGLKFSLVLWRYRHGQSGISFKTKAVDVGWTCASMPLIYFLTVLP
jgi:hypothetical protein